MKYKLNQIATTVLHLPPENALPKSRPLIQMHPVEEKNPNDHQTEDIFNVNLAWDTSIHFYQTKYLNKTSPLLYMTGEGGGAFGCARAEQDTYQTESPFDSALKLQPGIT